MDEEKRKQEIEAAKKEAADAARAEAKAELDKKQAELEVAQNELKGLKDKDLNFGKLNDKKEGLEKTVADLKTQLDAVAAAPINEAKISNLDALSGGDKTLRDKIEFQFNRVGSAAKTPAEVEAAMKEAYLLATGTAVKSPDAARRSQGAGGGNNRPAPSGAATAVDSDVKGLADNFNKNISDPKKKISDDDIKKYPLKPGQSQENMPV